jgi:hypothetical protein
VSQFKERDCRAPGCPELIEGGARNDIIIVFFCHCEESRAARDDEAISKLSITTQFLKPATTYRKNGDVFK